MRHAPSVSPAADRLGAEVVRLREENALLISELDAEIFRLRAKNARLLALNKELARLCEKALTRSAIVHPGFADEIRAALEGKP